MNAVKRCLALIAATLVVGACGGDPTVDDAGTNLSIRATPGAVWVRNNSSATVNIEAVDHLGGAASGAWTVGAIVGPFTVALDTAYQSTTAGSLGLKARFVVTPTAEGDGNVTINGTGGPITIPVRIAPDSNAFAGVVSDNTPALGDTITITAPAGTRFTSGTTVNFYNGPLALNLQQGATPIITGIDGTDSTVLHFIPPAGIEGQARITGIANVSTPSLSVTARTATLFPVLDTKTLAGSYSTGNTGVAPNTPIIVNLTQTGYRFRDGAGGGDVSGGTFPYAGSSQNGVAGRVIDSTHMIIYAPPGYNSVVKPTNLFNAAQPYYGLSLPMVDSLHIDSLPGHGLGEDDLLGGDTPGLVNVPSLQVGESYVYWDNGTFKAPTSPFNLGGPKQWVEVVVADAGTYTFTVSWDGSADVDNYLFLGDLSDFIGDCGSCGTNPEVVTTYSDLAAGDHIYWIAVLFDGAKPTRMKVTVTRDS